MMTMHDRKGASSTKQYFGKQERIEGVEAHPVRFLGKLSESLGLTGLFDRLLFNKLVDNKAPDGKLTPRGGENRLVGKELVFNSPKGATLVAEFSPNGEKIVQAFEEAIVEAFQTLIEPNAWVRTHPKGTSKTINMQSSDLLASLFQHRTSRASDPHLHAHLLIHSVTTDPVKGKRLALKSTEIHNRAKEIETAYMNGYRKRVEALGFKTVQKGTFWDIAGISDKTIRKFSERRSEIENLYSTVKNVSPKLRQKAGLLTRKPKADIIDLDALRKEWVSRLTAREKSVMKSLQIKPKVGRQLKLRRAYVARLRFREHNGPDLNRGKDRGKGMDR